MGILFIAGALAAVGYGFYLAVRSGERYPFSFSWRGISLMDPSGVAAEHLLGPRWSWNLAHHDAAHGWAALAQAVIWTLIGFGMLAGRRQVK